MKEKFIIFSPWLLKSPGTVGKRAPLSQRGYSGTQLLNSLVNEIFLRSY